MAAIQSLLSQSFSDLTKAGRKDGVSDQQRMRDALRSTLVEGRHRLESVFEAWDQNGNGSVDRMEFRHAMRALGFRASACDATEEQVDGWIDELFREFDDDGGGTVNYRELEKKLAKIKGAAVEQRYVVRSKSGGRIGAALGTSVRLDRASGKPVAVLLSEELAKGSALVRVMDLFATGTRTATATSPRSSSSRLWSHSVTTSLARRHRRSSIRLTTTAPERSTFVK